MFIIKTDLSDEEKKVLFNQINDAVTKRKGEVLTADIWSDKRKLTFPIKKYTEGVYYLMTFKAASSLIKEIRHTYKLNDNILRVLITNIG
jgi:small subunit ribosomal protein S6